MATVKLTVTLPTEQLSEVRALITAGRTQSISAFVKHAVDIALSDAAGWRDMLGEALQQTGGPLTKAERAWADAQLSPRKTSGKKKAA